MRMNNKIDAQFRIRLKKKGVESGTGKTRRHRESSLYR